jgi:phage repressor protein C with HTH and peptisase S24 domain
MSTLGDRIKLIRDELLKINQSSFADRLGFSRVATISDYEKNKRNPDISTLCKIADMGSVSLDWLLTGKGPIEEGKTAAKITDANEAEWTLYCEEYITIEAYAIKDSGAPKEFPKGRPVGAISIPKKDFKDDTVAIITEGESMSPNIVDGATIGINTKECGLISGKLYAVWLNYEGVTIKRVFVYPDRIVLKSDNPSFPETTIPSQSIGDNLIVGRVVWVYQRY